MSTSRHEPHDREWAAQERALREEKAGTRPPGDAREAEYRLIARALRHPPLAPVPDDFAVRTAALAEGRTAADERLEAGLQAGLLVLLALAGVISIALFDGAWLRMFALIAEQPAGTGVRTLTSWAGAIFACLAFSFLLERWLGRRRSTGR